MRSILFYFPISAALLLCLPLKGQEQNDSSHTASFSGSMSSERIDKFLKTVSNRNITLLRVNTLGGDASAAMDMGLWIYRNHVSVEVDSVCASACANYIFPAAKHKIIKEGALVVWHGSAEQADFKNIIERYDSISELKRSITDEEIIYLQENKKKVTYLKKLRIKQQDFYETINVNEKITRLGQEQPDSSQIWTTTIPVMNKFGILDIDASENYGAIKYISASPNIYLFDKSGIGIFSMDSNSDTTDLKFLGTAYAQ